MINIIVDGFDHFNWSMYFICKQFYITFVFGCFSHFLE